MDPTKRSDFDGSRDNRSRICSRKWNGLWK